MKSTNIQWKSEQLNTLKLIVPVHLVIFLFLSYALIYGNDEHGFNSMLFLLELNSLSIFLVYFGTRQTYFRPIFIIIAIIYTTLLIAIPVLIENRILSILLYIGPINLVSLTLLLLAKFKQTWFNVYFCIFLIFSIIPIILFIYGIVGLITMLLMWFGVSF